MSKVQLEIADQAILLKEMIQSMNQAEGACSQLIHQLQDPRFMFLREAIHVATQGCLKYATFEAQKQVFMRPI